MSTTFVHEALAGQAQHTAYANEVLETCASITDTGGGAREIQIAIADTVESQPKALRELAQQLAAGCIRLIHTHDAADEDEVGVEIRAHMLTL